MAHGINMDDVSHNYEWKYQSAWQLHQVFEVYDIIVISYNIIYCYGIGMQSQLYKTIDIFGSKSYMFVVVLTCYEWKCQSAWQLHQVFDVCDKNVISFDVIFCYGIGMQVNYEIR